MFIIWPKVDRRKTNRIFGTVLITTVGKLLMFCTLMSPSSFICYWYKNPKRLHIQ